MNQPIEAYPLSWPDGWPRRKSHARNRSKYKTTFLRARDELVRELRDAFARITQAYHEALKETPA